MKDLLKRSNTTRIITFKNTLIFSFLIFLLYISQVNFLLFHTISEMISAIIGFCIVIIAINAYKISNNKYFTFVAIAFGFADVIAIIHALSYKGMGIFPGYDANLPTQLWIISRYIESISIFISFLFLQKRDLKIKPIIAAYSVITLAALVFTLNKVIFPACFIEGQGVTLFKKVSELVISLLYLTSIFYTCKNRKSFNPRVFNFLLTSLIFSICTEITFIDYTNTHGIPSTVGHMFLIVSEWFLYKAIIETSLRKPFETLFNEVKDSNDMLKNSNELLLDVLKFGKIGYWELNVNTGSFYLSEEACQIFGGDKSISKMDELNKFFVFDYKGFIEDTLKKLEESGSIEDEKQYKKNDGSSFWIYRKIKVKSYAQDGKIKTIFAIVLDITKNKLIENELILAKKKADFSSQAKTEFISNMSHEFRTPLNAIIGFSDMMLAGTYGTLPDKVNKYLDNVIKSGNHLLSLVNDILDISKIEAGKVDLIYGKFNSEIAIQDVVTGLKSLTMQKNILINLDLVDAIVNADEIRFRQIVYNLLSNSIKFTPENGTVKIKSGINGNNLIVSIEDTGIGIKKENYEKIFEQFEQVDSSYVRAQEGTGLGLSLTKKLIEMQGGSIHFDSEYGVGSRFWFILPVSPQVENINKAYEMA